MDSIGHPIPGTTEFLAETAQSHFRRPFLFSRLSTVSLPPLSACVCVWLSVMGKGKRAHTISFPSIPSIPSINLTAPKSSADHSLSVSPPNTITTARYLNVPATPRWTPPRKPAKKYDDLEHKMEAAPLYVLVCTYLNYFVLILFGHLRDILGKLFKPQDYTHLRMNDVRYLSAATSRQFYQLE